MSRVRKETLLAHDTLSVKTPALREVRGEVRPANVRAVLLDHDEVPVVAGIGLVYRGRRYAGAAIPLEALLNLLGRRAVRRVGHEEMAVERIAGSGRPGVASERLGPALAIWGWSQRPTFSRRDSCNVRGYHATP